MRGEGENRKGLNSRDEGRKRSENLGEKETYRERKREWKHSIMNPSASVPCLVSQGTRPPLILNKDYSKLETISYFLH